MEKNSNTIVYNLDGRLVQTEWIKGLSWKKNNRLYIGCQFIAYDGSIAESFDTIEALSEHHPLSNCYHSNLQFYFADKNGVAKPIEDPRVDLLV